MQTELDRWFVHEVLVHEEALMRFLQRHWPHRDELPDLRQELYARIYEAGAKSRPTQPRGGSQRFAGVLDRPRGLQGQSLRK